MQTWTWTHVAHVLKCELNQSHYQKIKSFLQLNNQLSILFCFQQTGAPTYTLSCGTELSSAKCKAIFLQQHRTHPAWPASCLGGQTSPWPDTIQPCPAESCPTPRLSSREHSARYSGQKENPPGHGVVSESRQQARAVVTSPSVNM